MKDDGFQSAHPDHDIAQPDTFPVKTLEQEVSDRIDAGKIGPAQLRVFILCLTLGMLDGYDLAAMGLAAPLITRDWSIAPGSFGAALAAVMIGVATGNILFGWLGDRFGRKPVIIVSAIAIGVLSLGTITSSDVTHLTIWRFLLGIAFGAGFPNTYALVADIVPGRSRSFCMTLISAASSIGGILGGLVAPALSDWFGWKGIFLFGGLTPVIFAVLMIFLLWESPKVLASRNRLRQLSTTLKAFGLNGDNLPEARARHAAQRGRPMDLLKGGLLIVTISYLIGWIGCGFTYYIVANWMPTLLSQGGWSTGDAQRSITLLYAGSMAGGLTLSWIMDHWARNLIIPVIGCIAGAICFVAASIWFESPLLYAVLGGIGVTIGGVQYVMSAMGAVLYPSKLLATALSWTGALSRLGSVTGPIAGGWMLLAGWTPSQIMIGLCVVPLLSAAAFAVMAAAITRRSVAATA
jgi:AAHS family 4-hydroxybenzoate transporter-like MFS transporter